MMIKRSEKFDNMLQQIRKKGGFWWDTLGTYADLLHDDTKGSFNAMESNIVDAMSLGATAAIRGVDIFRVQYSGVVAYFMGSEKHVEKTLNTILKK
jgi:hypothetical protein